MKKENEYILNSLKANRGAIAAEVADDVEYHKTIDDIVGGTPEGLDKKYIDDTFNKLNELEYITFIDYARSYMIVGGISRIENYLKE